MTDILAVIVSICSLFVSLIIAFRQIVLVKHQNALPVVVNMLEKFRSLEFKAHQEFIFGRLNSDFSPSSGYYDLPEPARTHVLTYSHYMDHLGLLVAHKIIKKDLVISFIGNRIVDSWLVLKPFIETERVKRKRGYQQFFENLAYEAKKNPPVEIKKRLRLKPFA